MEKCHKVVSDQNGKPKKAYDLTEDERYQANLMSRWRHSELHRILDEYEGKTIEEVPEKYRDKIECLRALIKGFFEEFVEYLKNHNGRLPRGKIKENGVNKKVSNMTEDEIYETRLYSKWKYSEERKILNEYTGRPIEEVPEEFREKIATLRELGLGMKKSKLSQAKQQRDVAKAKNDQAKELESQVSGELKKRGKNHEEQ